MVSDDTTIFEWIIGGMASAASLLSGYFFMKTNKLQKDLTDHVLHAEQTYAKIPDMNEGFRILNIKMDNTQKSVQLLAVEQARQGENMKNMDKNIQDIANKMQDRTT